MVNSIQIQMLPLNANNDIFNKDVDFQDLEMPEASLGSKNEIAN
jgi:hypothetical protein